MSVKMYDADQLYTSYQREGSKESNSHAKDLGAMLEVAADGLRGNDD